MTPKLSAWNSGDGYILDACSFVKVFLRLARTRKETCQSVLPPETSLFASSTCRYLQHRLARPCVHLRWLAMTWAHFGRDQICTQVNASFSSFGHPTEVNASWVMSINLLLANEIQDMSTFKWFFFDLRVLVRKLASPFGHPTQVSTQVQLASTCDYLPVRLARA